MLKFLKGVMSDILWDLQKLLVQFHLEPAFEWNANKYKYSLEKSSFQKTIYFDNLTNDKPSNIPCDIFHSVDVIRCRRNKMGFPKSQRRSLTPRFGNESYFVLDEKVIVFSSRLLVTKDLLKLESELTTMLDRKIVSFNKQSIIVNQSYSYNQSVKTDMDI